MTNAILKKYKNSFKSAKLSQDLSTFVAYIYIVNIFIALMDVKYSVKSLVRSSKFGNLQQNANANHLGKICSKFPRKHFAQGWLKSIYCKLC